MYSLDFRTVETTVESSRLTPLIPQGIDEEWEEYCEERWMRHASDAWIRALTTTIANSLGVLQ